MDWFTHVLTAWAVAIALGLRRHGRLALVLGAAAPDFDLVTLPAVLLDPSLFFLDHRTYSHSILLGPLWALLFVAAVQRPRILGFISRHTRFDLRLPSLRSAALPIAAGVYLHVFMDALTVQGPSLFYPIVPDRFQLNLYFYSDVLPLAISSVVAVLFVWPRASPTARSRGVAVLLVAVVLLGAARIGVRDSLDADGWTEIPTIHPGEWWAWRDAGGAIDVRLLGAGGAVLFEGSWPDGRIERTGIPPIPLEAARARAESTWAFAALRMNAYALAFTAAGDADGWTLEYVDPVQAASVLRSGFNASGTAYRLQISVDGASLRAEWP